MQMGFAAFLNGASTAFLQGVDLLQQQGARLLAASEFAATLQLNVSSSPLSPPPALLCSGAPVQLRLMPTFEVAHAAFARLGLDDPQTRAWIAQGVRPQANPIGSQCSVFETLSHGLPL
jgi:hypothetical protein